MSSTARGGQRVADDFYETPAWCTRAILSRITTEIDPVRTRRKRDPGRCFLRAGWRRVGVSRGLVVLQAPQESEAA